MSRLTNTIGMLIPDGTNQYFSSMAQQFQRSLGAHHSALIVMTSDGSRSDERRYLQLLMEMRVDGIVFISVGTSFEAFDDLERAGVPVLVLDREVPGLENSADFLFLDNSAGMQLAVGHLVGLGHSDIGLVQGLLDTEPGRARTDGFRRAMDDHGLLVQEEWLFDGDFTVAAGRDAASTLATSETRPSALVAANDLMALGIVQACSEHELLVPGDLSVVGFDDVDFCGWIHPTLTSVRQDVAEIARRGSEMLSQRISAARTHPGLGGSSRVEVVAPTLSVRNSTSPPTNTRA